jgi:type I restriction enzyme S subunit
MGLTKLGKYIEPSDLRNSDGQFGEETVVGLSTQKQMITTKADLTGVSLNNYKLFPPGYFAYVPDTSRRGDKMSLAYNNTDNTFLVSSISVVFGVSDEDQLCADYLYMYFNRPEFDRYARFNSWGSARETFSWEDMCDIDFYLPPIEIQRKYADIYNAMVANQKAYELGLEDLKLVCDGYIENLRKQSPSEEIGKYLRECDEKNTDLSVTLAQGVDVNMQFIPAKREAVDKESTRIVRTGQFAFNKVVKANGTKLPIALRQGEDCIISGSYQVFEVADKKHLIPEYLMMWMSRPETQRRCGFNAWGSTRDVFPFDELGKLRFPIPSIDIQQDIVNIYNAYIERKDINEKLKERIKNICPILIKGSREEAEKEVVAG